MSSDEKLDSIWKELTSDQDYMPHEKPVIFEWSPGFCWWIIPTIEINTSIKEVAIYIFCLAIYIRIGKR